MGKFLEDLEFGSATVLSKKEYLALTETLNRRFTHDPVHEVLEEFSECCKFDL